MAINSLSFLDYSQYSNPQITPWLIRFYRKMERSGPKEKQYLILVKKKIKFQSLVTIQHACY